MTALTKYDRLEATGLWRTHPSEQRREVVVSIGDATLIISDINDRPLTHWSLAAVEKAQSDGAGVTYFPAGDPEETLELDASETEMIKAINALRRAIARSRPHPGRVRWVGAALSISAVTALALFWLPGALVDHALRVVPEVKEAEIGTDLLSRIERVSGPPCTSPAGTAALATLARRSGVARVVVVPDGVREALSLPGGTVVINRTLVEDFEEPDVAAGFVLAERVRSAQTPPLRQLLEHAGTRATATLLTTGEVPDGALDRFAEAQLASPAALPEADVLLPAFAAAEVRSTPYARARDVSGELTVDLIEADPMSGAAPPEIMPDAAWIQLQAICEA